MEGLLKDICTILLIFITSITIGVGFRLGWLISDFIDRRF